MPAEALWYGTDFISRPLRLVRAGWARMFGTPAIIYLIQVMSGLKFESVARVMIFHDRTVFLSGRPWFRPGNVQGMPMRFICTAEQDFLLPAVLVALTYADFAASPEGLALLGTPELSTADATPPSSFWGNTLGGVRLQLLYSASADALRLMLEKCYAASALDYLLGLSLDYDPPRVTMF